MKNAFIEAVKEGLRIVVLAIIPVIVAGLENGIGIDWKIVGTIGAVALLRFIDKWLHEAGKDQNHKTMVRGLTQF